MKFLAVAAVIGTVAPLASAFTVTEDFVDCYAGPSTNYEVEEVYTPDDDITVTCQRIGDSDQSEEIWYKTQNGCYIQDIYVHTGNETVTAVCSDDGDAEVSTNSTIAARDLFARASVPGPVKDDYPYKSGCGGVDPWKYYKCQCTSFVAFRINKRLGINFHNRYKGQTWGNANQWDEAAKKSSGVKINKTPKPGAIAQLNRNSGHVAWVYKVDGNKVSVEEYNWNNPKKYGKRTVAKTAFDNYIHLR